MHGPFNCIDRTAGCRILGAHGSADRMGALAHRVDRERRLDRGCERVGCRMRCGRMPASHARRGRAHANWSVMKGVTTEGFPALIAAPVVPAPP